MPVNGLTCVAQWTVNPYTITFNSNGGSAVSSITQDYGTSVTAPADPTREGYTFAGWSPAVPSTMPVNGLTCVAQWTINQYTLTLEANHADWGTLTGGGDYDYNTEVTITATPNAGYKFVKWQEDENTNASRTVTVTEDVTFTANFDVDIADYTIKHWQQNLTEDGYNEVETETTSGTVGTATAAEAKTYEGFTARSFEQVTIAVSGTVVNIYYDRNPYTITFNSNGGSAVASITQGYGTDVTVPASPHRDGYSFTGWSPAVPSTMPLNGATCVAQWNENVHMVAVTSGGNGSISGSVSGVGVSTPSSEITATPDPGYKFDHWDIPTGVTIAGGTNKDNPITINAAADDLEIKANFVPETYNIVYKDKDGADFSGVHGTDYPTTHTYATATDLVEPTKENFYFEGWYTSSDCSTGKVTTLGATAYTDHITLYANWLSSATKFTVTWQDGSGSENTIKTEEIAAGQIPEFDYQKPATPAYRFELIGWADEENVRYVFPTKLPPVTKDVTYYALYNPIIRNKQVSTDVKVEDTERADVTTVRPGGRLNVTTGSLTTTDFVLEATLDNSGELIGEVTADNVYFDLRLNTQRRHWRAFTVPFEIDLKQHQILADGVSMPLGVQYDIVYYRGDIRAEQGKVPACWHYVEDDANWILTPGVAYLIVFGRDVNTVRFTKKDEASINYTGTVSVAENNGASDDVNGGWNGIGNPATYHALLSAGVTECQVHNGEEIGSDGYVACDMGKFIVGKAVFVQVAEDKSVVVNKATASDEVITPKPQSAPRRAQANATGKNRFDVQIAPADGQMADRMFLLADEDKEDKYIILQDLAKAGLSTKSAQMWVDRYGTKLCKNTAVMRNNQAEYPLGISVPVAGEYQITVAERPSDDAVLYLTFDGSPIWNLTYAPFVANFEKGTTQHYGLKWVRSNAPAITTGVDNTQAGTQPTAQKILLDGKVYILRGDNVYSVDGQLVK